MATQHDDDHAGLQKHSIGGSYPWTIRGVGDDWQAFNCITGEAGPRRSSYREALDALPALHRQRELAGERRAHKLRERKRLRDIIDRGLDDYEQELEAFGRVKARDAAFAQYR